MAAKLLKLLQRASNGAAPTRWPRASRRGCHERVRADRRRSRVADLADADERADRRLRRARIREATPLPSAAMEPRRSSAAAASAAIIWSPSEAGAIAGVLPLTDVHSPLFGRALVSTGFGDRRRHPRRRRARRRGAGRAPPGELAERLGCPSLELRGGAVPDGLAGARRRLCRLRPRPAAATTRRTCSPIPRKQRAEVRRALGLRARRSRSARDGADRAAHYPRLCGERAQSRHAGLPARACSMRCSTRSATMPTS